MTVPDGGEGLGELLGVPAEPGPVLALVDIQSPHYLRRLYLVISAPVQNFSALSAENMGLISARVDRRHQIGVRKSGDRLLQVDVCRKWQPYSRGDHLMGVDAREHFKKIPKASQEETSA